MSVVKILGGTGRRDPVAMLECAKGAELVDVVILGWDGKDKLFYRSSNAEWREDLWLLFKAQQLIGRMSD